MTIQELEVRVAVLEVALSNVFGDIRVRMAKIIEQNELLIKEVGECHTLIARLLKEKKP
jgi:hypothetical protein